MISKIKRLLIRSVYHRQVPLWTAVIAVVSLLFSWHVLGAIHPVTDRMEVDFLDIGQGDSIYVRAPNGNSFLMDGGPAVGQVTSRLAEVKDVFDRHIDVIIGTHSDSDHIGGLESVVKAYSPSLFMDPSYLGTTQTYRSLAETVEENHVPRIVARKGLRLILDAEHRVELQIMYPTNQYAVDKYNECEFEKTQNRRKSRKKCEKVLDIDTNESSIVARLAYGSSSVMLTGDAPISVEHYLMSIMPKGSLSSTVLKVGHHGSKTSTSADFLEAVHPEHAVISVGAGNRYGHPHQQTLDILQAYNSGRLKVYRTDQVGTVRMEMDVRGNMQVSTDKESSASNPLVH